jgi:GT2 family glycosyltransferase
VQFPTRIILAAYQFVIVLSRSKKLLNMDRLSRRIVSIGGASCQWLDGFDERFTVAWREDTDLEFALRTQGYRLARQPAAIVVHPVRPMRWGISLTLQRNNIFNALLYKKHPLLYRWFIQTVLPCAIM